MVANADMGGKRRMVAQANSKNPMVANAAITPQRYDALTIDWESQ